jgi:hypothetical protein
MLDLEFSDEDFDKIFNDMIKEDKEKQHTFITEGYKIFPLVKEKGSLMSDDNLYSDNEELQKIDNLVYAVASLCLSYCRHINKDISTDEFFYTERCYLQYNDNLYEIEEVSGQGTFDRISVAYNISNDIFIKWEDILNYVKELNYDRRDV